MTSIVDYDTMHTQNDDELLNTFDQLTEDLQDGSNMTETCFNMLKMVRTTIEAEMAIRGLTDAIQEGNMETLFG